MCNIQSLECGDELASIPLKRGNWLQFHLSLECGDELASIPKFVSPSLFIHLFGWYGDSYEETKERGWLIWHAILWVIWKIRNDRIFNNIVKEVDEMVEQIKVVSRHWSMNRLNIMSCLFYEWCWNLAIAWLDK